ncbi:MAG: GNAT family N-acetyltransferase [Sporolactobacillus sp.]
MAACYIRLATLEDLPAIMAIIRQAQTLLAQDGIPQWQNNYPNRSTIETDIAHHYSYVLMVGQVIAGAATLLQEDDPNYYRIYEGAWIKPSDTGYTSIHRIAIAPGYHGQHLADFFFSHLLSVSYGLGYREVRIDTHARNKRMQHVIEKAGFGYAGIVYMNDDADDQRQAYQLFLS